MRNIIMFWSQITGIPVVFISALEGRGRLQVMNEVIGTYKRWCSRLSTGRLNRWLIKVCTYQWIIKDYRKRCDIMTCLIILLC